MLTKHPKNQTPTIAQIAKATSATMDFLSAELGEDRDQTISPGKGVKVMLGSSDATQDVINKTMLSWVKSFTAEPGVTLTYTAFIEWNHDGGYYPALCWMRGEVPVH